MASERTKEPTGIVDDPYQDNTRDVPEDHERLPTGVDDAASYTNDAATSLGSSPTLPPSAGGEPARVKRYAVGTMVEYYSASVGRWIPAQVVGFTPEGNYSLDVQPNALPTKVRLPARPEGRRGAAPTGTALWWAPQEKTSEGGSTVCRFATDDAQRSPQNATWSTQDVD